MEFNAGELTDISEKGFTADGKRTSLDRRLFVQLLVFKGCSDPAPLIEALKSSSFTSVLYTDVADPGGVALLTAHEDPVFFVTELRDFLGRGEFAKLVLQPEFTMFGRTYALGHERGLEDWLLERTRRVVTNPEWKWAVWYPLRRRGSFALLSANEQREILMEHGMIGRAFGDADLGHDVRLACHGIDKNDNDFVIGLIGKELYPLSALVQTMRKTKQTSTHLEQLGPFFVGRVVWQSGEGGKA